MGSILIVGGYGTFTEELINKFYKEKWHIYTLTNSQKLVKPAHVFEQYTFAYDSASVEEVITSCRPDAILFMGAYDPLYRWEDDHVQEESLNYIAGLSNLLMAAASFGVRHFVYVSSDRVYEDEYAVDIREEMPASPNSFQGMTISQGENLAMHFNATTQMEVTVLRIARMYGIPVDRESCTDIYSKMCMKALVSGRLYVNAKKVLSALYVKDGVEAVYLLIDAPERKYKLYHVSSREEVTEDKVAELIREKYSHPVEIVDRTIGLRQRVILSNERFCSEFSFQVRTGYEEMIPMIIAHMKRHKNLFLHGDEQYGGKRLRDRMLRLLKKAVPFLETVVFFFPVYILNNRVADSIYFGQINFYLLYVLLFAVVHGRRQAILSALLSVIGYCFGQMYTTSGFSLLIDINTYIWTAQIFVVGLTVGHLKDKFRETEEDKNERIDFLADRLSDITVINSSNTKLKNYFAEKLISSAEGVGRIYEITSRLERAKMGEVLFSALDTLSEIMETKDVSIYLVSNESYCRLASASSEKARSLGKSLAMADYAAMFDVLIKKQVYINRSLDTELPMMGSALFDDKGNMRIIVLLWNIPYEQMTLYQANLLSVVGALVYAVVVRDADYMDALVYRRFLPGTGILQQEAFESMLDIYRNAGEKGYAQSSVFYIQAEGMPLTELNDKLRLLLRETDYVGMVQGGNIGVLLTNTNKNESAYVKARLEENGIATYQEKKI
ncbi:nucleoside-diphosphate-sugar epimerase [Kineothrix alysoides]|uniref:Nucleoside-diphosphate-sugar epimerase n=1 Tax=Kineothrix alysoides TaxID=1469948 RepID=A0A4R1QYS1_9FIRM|nr:sugar nucleotide-binding protein [Kineothrix alysoides]TCL58109.1 nucleoside-diphosphate-sugar epimerase [Kineothrix alysoides]